MAAAVLAPVPSRAQSDNLQAHFGQLIYRLFCSGCHGADGRGNGELAKALDIPLNDLTQLSRQNGGVFPADAVADAIAGRGPRGHTELNMAPWAEMFADEFEQFASGFAVDELVARRIAHVVAYIESIQED